MSDDPTKPTAADPTGWYVLDANGSPVPADSLKAWARWAATHDKHLALDHVGDVQISTVFLGLDHSHGEGEPVLFETMIFGGPNDQYQERYTRRTAAFARHAELVSAERRRLRDSLS